MNQEPIASVHAGGGRASSAQVDRAVADGRTQESEQRQTARNNDLHFISQLLCELYGHWTFPSNGSGKDRAKWFLDLSD